jgi:hypothetical protein
MKSEHQEQVDFIHKAKKLLRAQDKAYLIPLLFAIPNGGKRDARTASSLKMEGVRAGVPDLFFAHPTPSAYGLFLEMKVVKGGRVSPDQKTMILALEEEGYCCQVVKGCVEAIDIFEKYLSNKI